MKKLKYSIFVLFILVNIGGSASAQKTYVNQEWEKTEGEVGDINRTVSVVDNAGNVYVASNVLNGNGSADVSITKFDRNGVLLWQQTYNGSGNGDDYAVQIVLGSSNSVFVVSALQELNSLDWGLLRYSSAGVLELAATWDGQSNGIDIPADIGVDANGDIYMAGASQSANGFLDYAVVKLNANGSVLWESTYDYAGLHDGATSLRVDNGQAIVTGASAATPTEWDYATLRLDGSDGTITDEERTVVAGVGLDNALAVTSDDLNNIYITGYVEVNGNKNIQTVKIDSDFELEWVKTFDGGLEDIAKTIGVDDFGNVYIAGSSEQANGGKDLLTIKYDAAGNEIWTKSYGSGGGIYSAEAEKLAVTNDGGVVVTGTIQKDADKDFATIKYSPDGELKFSKKFDASEEDDQATSVTVKNDEILVTGSSMVDGVKKATTVKYSAADSNTDLVFNSDGKPAYASNELLIRFDASALILANIDKVGIQYGKLTDFLTQSAADQVWSAVDGTCNSDKCDINVYKIFKQLTTSHQTALSRSGKTVRIPQFWATLLLEFPVGVDIEQVKNDLEALFPLVKYTDMNLGMNLASEPNDQYYNSQESLNSGSVVGQPGINVEPAWDFESGQPFVKVGIFDSGIQWDHEDFGDGTVEGSKVDGWDFRDNHDLNVLPNGDLNLNGDPSNSSHGTLAAGIVGALRNNYVGVAGIAGGDNDYAYGLENTGAALFGMVINFPDDVSYEEINHALVSSSIYSPNEEHSYGLHVMNHSWSINAAVTANLFIDDNINLLREGLHFANRMEVVVAALRGNYGTNNAEYPGTFDDDWILCVGGTGTDGNYIDVNAFNGGFTASYGVEVDVAAPAALNNIKSTHNAGGWVNFNGTSAATPHVSGVAALLISYLNHEEPHYDNLAPEDVEEILQMSALDVNDIGPDVKTGYGRLDAGAALAQVDKNKYHLSHFGTDAFPHNRTITQTGTGLEVELSEQYINLDEIAFQPQTPYTVNIYQVEATVTHSLPASDEIEAYWARPSSSHVFPLFDGDNILLPHEKVGISNLNHNSATLRGYVYEVFDEFGTLLGWWPRDANATPPELTYTILRFDPLLSVSEWEGGMSVSVHPNPATDIQKLVINLKTETIGIITLYDLAGKKVGNIHKGILNSGLTTLNWNMALLKSGVYLYKIETDDAVYQIKTVKH